MITKAEIRTLLEKANPNCKSNSCNAYVISLFKILSKYEEIHNTKTHKRSLKTLNNYTNVMEVINSNNWGGGKNKSLPLTTKKNYLTAILVATRDKPYFKKSYEKYRNITHTIRSEYDKHIKSNKKSKSQEDNWVSWKQLEDVMKDIHQAIKDKGILKKSDITNKDKKLIQQWVLVSLYILQKPRRAEYSNTAIIKEKLFNKLSNDEKKKNNWLVVKSRNTKYFYFTKYKTDKKFGNIRVNVEPKLNSVLNVWLKYNKGEWLLYDNRGGMMSPNNLVKALQRAFSPTGKKISVSMIRHIYNSEKGESSKIDQAKLEQQAKDMGHSVETSLDYVKK